MSTAERTRLALESITSGKIAAARPSTVTLKDNAASEYIRYTPASTSDEGKQRIIKMSTVAEDPLEPPRFKHKKIPRANDEPPPPVMQSPPRRATVQEQKDWQIPPCISNWKNNKGYTIPLDKRLAADGRGLQDVSLSTRGIVQSALKRGFRLTEFQTDPIISLRPPEPSPHRSISMTISPNSPKPCTSRTDTRVKRFGNGL